MLSLMPLSSNQQLSSTTAAHTAKTHASALERTDPSHGSTHETDVPNPDTFMEEIC